MRITQLLAVIVVALLALMALLVFVNVVLRYGFNSSISSSEEVARFLFVFLVFFGSILAYHERSHMSVRLVHQKIPPKLAPMFEFIIDLSVLLISLYIAHGAYHLFVLNYQNYAPLSQIPRGINFLALFIFAISLTLISVSRIITYLRRIV